MAPRIYRSKPLALPPEQERAPFFAAELLFHGLNLRGASYRAAVFFNAGRVRHNTPEDDEHGYAGAFFLFGKGGCFGEEGHCDPPPRRDRFDLRLAQQTNPTLRTVDVTEALRRELASGASELVVSVVPELADTAGVKLDIDTERPLQFESLSLMTYDAYAPAAQRFSGSWQ